MDKRENRPSGGSSARSFIQEILGAALPGERLPGIRVLMKESGLGRLRLEKVLREFEAQGAISVRPQSGRYRAMMPPEPAPLVFIHFSPRPVMENDRSFPGGTVKLFREYAAEKGMGLEIIRASGLDDETLCRLLKERRAERAFIWGAENAGTVKAVAACVPYTVSILPRYPELVGSELRDSPEMTVMQLEYLFHCNYRRIGYIHNAEKEWSKTPVQMLRLLDYYRIMAEKGIKIEPEWVFYCAYNREIFNSSMHRLICCSPSVEAVIVPGSSLKLLYDFCAANGIRIGRALAVMCSDDTEPDLSPRATSVTNSPREIGTAAWEIMEKTMKGECCRERTCLRIITGETVPFIRGGS